MALSLPTPIDTASPLGYGLLCTQCTVTLPMPDGSMRTTTTVQPTLGIGVDARTGAPLPSSSVGRQLLAGALQCRLNTTNGDLIDVSIPTTVGAYGYMLPDVLNGDFTEEAIGIISASVDAQVRQDERVFASFTRGILVGDSLLLPITVQDATGPFKLTLAIDTLTSTLSILSSP